jgi:hypothetical protein
MDRCRCSAVLVSQRAKLPPSGILLRFRRVRVFVVIEPEIKPIDRTLLHGESLPWADRPMICCRKPLNLRRTVRRTNESGSIVEHIVQRRPRRWYWRAESGAYFIQVLYDGEAVALSKGKATVECADIAALIAAMDVLEAATRAGELDVGLAKIAETSRRIKKKAA